MSSFDLPYLKAAAERAPTLNPEPYGLGFRVEGLGFRGSEKSEQGCF